MPALFVIVRSITTMPLSKALNLTVKNKIGQRENAGLCVTCQVALKRLDQKIKVSHIVFIKYS
jgi:hypothetical protein